MRLRKQRSSVQASALELTPAEHGKSLRKQTPRAKHSEWEPDAQRPDPLAVLKAQGAERVEHLVPIRYGRMLASAGAFYRGGAAIMAWDLSRTPSSGLRVQCCGDAHLLNFGLYASLDRRMVFDLNDFDETLPARSNGTSNGSSPASPSPRATTAATRRSLMPPRSPPPTATARGWRN